jgi:hypothetical protein
MHTPSAEFLERVREVRNKRAKLVLDTIIENGSITTAELKQRGYQDPRRAARDVRELGFRLKTKRVTIDGRSMAQYSFDDGPIESAKAGRSAVPKSLRLAIIQAAGGKCQICRSSYNLQVDHRVPYEVAGESLATQQDSFQALCGSCNRLKSWACEHCENWRTIKSAQKCGSCYWSGEAGYSHVALRDERRVDITWERDEVKDYSVISLAAEESGLSVADYLKDRIKHSRTVALGGKSD